MSPVRFLRDQGLPVSAAPLFHAPGLFVIAPRNSTGSARKTKRESFAVVSVDADFHTLMALTGASTPSVILLRIQRLGDVAFSALIENVCAQLQEALSDGILVTVTSNGVRTRALPVVRSP